MSGDFSLMKVRSTAPLVLVALAGCELAGACEHTFEDPVIALQLTGESRPARVAITDMLIDGRDAGSMSAFHSMPGFGFVGVTDTLYCEAACAFGTLEGNYTFKVSAQGYQTRTVTLDARYEEFDGGCPSSNSGSTEVRISLLPES